MKYDPEVELLSLCKLEFEELDGEYEKGANAHFTIEVETGDAGQDVLPMSWTLVFGFTSVFRIRALYRMYVSNYGGAVIDKDELVRGTYYRVLSEFSMLIATLTKAFGTTPLVVEASNLMELAGYKSKA